MRLGLVSAIVGIGLLTGCVELNDRTAQDMPTGYLCSMLDPNTYITNNADRRIIFKELKARDADCILPSGTSKQAL